MAHNNTFGGHSGYGDYEWFSNQGVFLEGNGDQGEELTFAGRGKTAMRLGKTGAGEAMGICQFRPAFSSSFRGRRGVRCR